MPYRTRTQITPYTPLRLGDAVKIAFPLGGMTVGDLRRERDCNRLVIEKIAGKEFTTLAHIERMRELCREEGRDEEFSSRFLAETRAEKARVHQTGSLEATAGMLAQAALQMRLQPRKKR